ncbi:MAG: hypothetical protein QF440_04680 [Candidatus Thalassarchaeaceae archaeon]|jgi:hypothetical protein|nr:hypothetical protein [Candidatus Thalassarchaeaceae archaeon]
MSTLEVDQSGEIGVARHPRRQILIDFLNHLKENNVLRFSYPMPDQENGEGWMMFLYSPVSQAVIDSFEA